MTPGPDLAPTRIATSLTHDGRVLRIALRGGKGNVVDGTMARELGDALAAVAAMPRLHAVTLSAEGPSFSFGASVPEHAPDRVAGLLRGLHRCVEETLDLGVPLLAAVRGHCLGGGLELVLAAHRITASPDATFAQPEIRLGMFAPAGSVLLPERVARGFAEEMLLTGRSVSAAEALAAGLVDAVDADPEGANDRFVETHLLPQSASAIRFAVRAAREVRRPRLHAALRELERRFVEDVMQTRDAREGIASFVERRPPAWVDA